MDDLTVRLIVVGGTLVAALAAILLARALAQRPRRVLSVDLEPGVYLFTSATCSQCETARAILSDAVGERGFTELAWEDDPALFEQIGVDAVPTTLVVYEEGRGRLWRGVSREVVERLGP